MSAVNNAWNRAMKTISAYMAVAVAFGLSSVQAETTTGDPLAEVNGEAVTADDVDRTLGVNLPNCKSRSIRSSESRSMR